jgi:hypothetical protein
LKNENGELKIFRDKIGPNDLKQGGLGSSYFISVLGILAKQPELIKKMFF